MVLHSFLIYFTPGGLSYSDYPLRLFDSCWIFDSVKLGVVWRFRFCNMGKYKFLSKYRGVWMVCGTQCFNEWHRMDVTLIHFVVIFFDRAEVRKRNGKISWRGWNIVCRSAVKFRGGWFRDDEQDKTRPGRACLRHKEKQGRGDCRASPSFAVCRSRLLSRPF